MTDRELLELAAKAAGIEILWDARGPYRTLPGIHGNDKEWNPLTDDGDALRLAVKLRFVVACYEDICEIEDLDGNLLAFDVNADPCAATRRAIVRAAAKIGKGMK